MANIKDFIAKLARLENCVLTPVLTPVNLMDNIMTKKEKKINSKKPKKPYPEYPLYAHATKRWAKKIRGKIHYFGPWEEPDAALELYLKQCDYLHAGQPIPFDASRASVDEVVNRFLDSKNRQRELGEISQQMFNDYRRVAGFVLDVFGRSRPAETLRPDDFGKLRAYIAKDRSPITTTIHLTRIRTIFKWAAKNEIIPRPPRYGDEFNTPTAANIRKHRQATQRTLTAKQIRSTLDHAGLNIKAAILLGINAGLGNTDISELRHRHLDLAAGTMDYPRPKTGAKRRAILWPETIAAVKAVIAKIKKQKHRPAEHADRVFLTKYGNPYIQLNDNDGNSRTDSIGLEFGKLLVSQGIKQRGDTSQLLGFYSLRHTFRTIADETRDFPAIDLIMGHIAGNTGGAFNAEMADRYREKISDERLRAIADHVHDWLFDTDNKKDGSK